MKIGLAITTEQKCIKEIYTYAHKNNVITTLLYMINNIYQICTHINTEQFLLSFLMCRVFELILWVLALGELFTE